MNGTHPPRLAWLVSKSLASSWSLPVISTRFSVLTSSRTSASYPIQSPPSLRRLAPRAGVVPRFLWPHVFGFDAIGPAFAHLELDLVDCSFGLLRALGHAPHHCWRLFGPNPTGRRASGSFRPHSLRVFVRRRRRVRARCPTPVCKERLLYNCMIGERRGQTLVPFV